MAAVKWIFVVIFGLGSVGSFAMAFVESGGPRTPIERKAPELALRPFPQMTLAAGKAPAQSPEPVAAKPPEPEPAKPPEPVAAKPPEPEAAKTPEPVAAKPPEPKPEPVAAKPPEPKPEPVAAKPPEPKPEPAEAKPPEPKPEPKPEAAAKPPEPKLEGLLNLRASDTADVFLDGKKLGGSPLLGIKAKAGNHKVRFDCYDAAGNTISGPSQTITVKADQEVDVEFPCPSE